MQATRRWGRRFPQWAVGAGVVVALVGGGHLGAGLSGATTHLGAASITMKTNSALSLFLAGWALALVASGRANKGVGKWVGRSAAAVVFAVGSLTLAEDIADWKLGIDELLAQAPPGALGALSPNRLGSPGAVCFTLAGIALLVLSDNGGRKVLLAQALALGVCLLAFLSVVGYLYDVRVVSAWARLTAIAWPTAVSLLVLGLGLLWSRPEQGVMALVSAEDSGGVALRRLALPIIFVLVGLGWLRLLGERRGLYDAPLGTGLLVAVFVVLFSAWALFTARTLAQTELALRESRAKLDAALASMSDAIFISDAQGRFIEFNEAFAIFHRFRSKAECARTFADYPDILDVFRADGTPAPVEQWAVPRALRGETAINEHYRLQRKDTGETWVGSYSFAPIRNKEGAIVGSVVAVRDITEQRRAQEALTQSEQRYRCFVEASSLVIWRTNARGEVDGPIPSWSAYTGQSDQEAAGFGWMKAIAPEDRGRISEAWKAASAARGVYEVEYCLKRHDGHWRHILARGVPVLENDGRVREYIGTCIDVTDQREAEAAMRKQARLIDLAPAATLVRALDGTISSWSEGAERLYGWTREEAIGRRTYDLLRTEFPAHLEQIVEQLQSGGKWHGELRHRTKDGRLVTVESYWLGQFAPDGQVTELLESNMDITERKRNEQDLRRLKDELELRVEERTAELSAANKELEAFGYSVSHDLRAPLRHIDSYINLLQRNVGPSLDEKSQKHVRIIAEAARRMGNLIDDLLVLSRLGRATMEERAVSLRRLVDEVRQELAPGMAGRHIEWHVGSLPQIQADPNLLRSALTNLLANAIKYTRQRDPAQIEVGSREQNGQIICFVRDNGAGFDMRFVDKLFGVFQRLHRAEEFEGTGIGLASVRRVIQRHGGQTWAEGELGRGATFYFSLPRSRLMAQAKGCG
jgi:PAS domain S-box-containing protein